MRRLAYILALLGLGMLTCGSYRQQTGGATMLGGGTYTPPSVLVSANPLAIPASLFGLHKQCTASGAAANNSACDTSTPVFTTPDDAQPVGRLRWWDTGVKFSQIEASNGSFTWTLVDAEIHEARAMSPSPTIIWALNPSTPSWACSGVGSGSACMPTDAALDSVLAGIFGHSESGRPIMCQATGPYAGRKDGCVSELECWNEPNTSSSFGGTQSQLVHVCARMKQDVAAHSEALVTMAMPTYTYAGSITFNSSTNSTSPCRTANGGHFADGTYSSPEALLCGWLASTSSVPADGTGKDLVRNQIVSFHGYPATSTNTCAAASGLVNASCVFFDPSKRANGVITKALADNGLSVCDHNSHTSRNGAADANCVTVEDTEDSWGCNSNCGSSNIVPRIGPQIAGESSTWPTLTAAFVEQYYLLCWTNGLDGCGWYWLGSGNNTWGTIFCSDNTVGVFTNNNGCTGVPPQYLQDAGKAYGIIASVMTGRLMDQPCAINTSTGTVQCHLMGDAGYQALIVWNNSGSAASFTPDTTTYHFKRHNVNASRSAAGGADSLDQLPWIYESS